MDEFLYYHTERRSYRVFICGVFRCTVIMITEAQGRQMIEQPTTSLTTSAEEDVDHMMESGFKEWS